MNRPPRSKFESVEVLDEYCEVFNLPATAIKKVAAPYVPELLSRPA